MAIKFPLCTFSRYTRMVMPDSNTKSCAIYLKSMHSNNHFCKAVVQTFCCRVLALEARTTHRVKRKPDYVLLPRCSVSSFNTRIPFSAAFMNINCRDKPTTFNNFCPRSNLKIQSTMVTELKQLHRSSHFQRKLLFIPFWGVALLKAG